MINQLVFHISTQATLLNQSIPVHLRTVPAIAINSTHTTAFEFNAIFYPGLQVWGGRFRI